MPPTTTRLVREMAAELRRVYRWMKPRVSRASGVTVREAVKYLPVRQRGSILRVRRT